MDKRKLMRRHMARGLAKRIQVSSLDAARSHLNVAIQLYFMEGDPIAIHTLAVAAYEVIHDLNRRAKGPPLLYDSPDIPEDMRREMVGVFKDAAWFFKHADNRKRPKQVRDSIDFDAESSDLFMLLAIQGLRYLKIPRTNAEITFEAWQTLRRPYFFHDDFLKGLRNTMPVEAFRRLKKMRKKPFFDFMTKAQRRKAAR